VRRALLVPVLAVAAVGLTACGEDAPVTTATLARPGATTAAAPSTAPVTAPATLPPTTLPPTTPAPTTVPTTVPTTLPPTTPAPTIPKVVPGRVVLVGDSVMAALEPNYTDAAREVLGAAGWQVDIDAEVNRSTLQGGQVVAALNPAPNDTVVLMLGHNDAGSARVFGPRVEAVLQQLAGVQRVYWLTMREPRYAEANAVLAAAQATHPNLRLIPWAASIQPGWTAKDGLHLNGSGATGMAQLILQAIG
jgi:lysophospholipase L1-like esterase